ncbi:ribosome maturation factor RimM [Peptoniphilus sp. MSJ-1]|uniref:Ribosome maturation factor RimM n=1 Tax=Peptoniphilus ovalis TaxID=2841503 RepID=A0ABS6FFR3_9FIRM|nr:ribosome maturation factor RimM [Peptoniphilus ovalis]MBU5669006.1 ribosome maturation factor RimM [Peptoniphilus ovalis]
MKKINNNKTCIGKIINTHGIKGELKIDPYTFDTNRFSKLDRVYVGDDLEKFYIKKVRTNNFVYLVFKDNENINNVEHLKGSFIYIDDEERLELSKDQYYVSDLIGKEVYDTSDNYIGILKDVLEYPANDIFLIESEDKEIYQIPAVKEFIKSVDSVIKIKIIEGMIL